MTTPSFGDGTDEPEYHEADFGHSDEAYAVRDEVSDIISDGGCECGLGPTKAEMDWTDLMSARPKFFYNPIDYLPESTSAVGPSPETFQYVIGPLQPSGIEEHALDRIQEHWKDEAIETSDDAAAGLSKLLKQLSGSWVGEDFDRGAEMAEEAIKNLNTLHDNGNSAREILQRQEDALHLLQGGDVGVTPVPPAQFRHTGGSRLDKPGGGTHMRPSFHVGPCRVIDDERAMEMHGIDPEFQNSVHDRIDLRAEEIMKERVDSMSGPELDAINETQFVKEAQNEARAELNDEVVAYEQEIQADYDAEVARIGDDITHRRDQADDVLRDSPFPVESRLGKGDRGEPTLVDPPPPSPPDASGMSEPGGYTPGTVASPDDVANRTATSGGSNPWAGWSGSDSEDSELSDGLSAGSGGPGLASPGGAAASGASPAGTGPGGSAGVGGGVVGPGSRAGNSGVGPGGAGRVGPGVSSGSRGSAGHAGAGRAGVPGGMIGGPGGGAGGQQAGRSGGSSPGRGSLGSMGRTSSSGNAPAAGTASHRGTGAGGAGLMAGPPGRGGGSKDKPTGKGDDRTLGAMGRPPASAAGTATPTAATPSSPSADSAVGVQGNAGSSKGASKLDNLIAAKRAAESKKNSSKQAKDEDSATTPKEDEPAALDSIDYEDMDIHDQQMIDDDYWGAYNKNDDQYR